MLRDAIVAHLAVGRVSLRQRRRTRSARPDARRRPHHRGALSGAFPNGPEGVGSATWPNPHVRISSCHKLTRALPRLRPATTPARPVFPRNPTPLAVHGVQPPTITLIAPLATQSPPLIGTYPPTVSLSHPSSGRSIGKVWPRTSTPSHRRRHPHIWPPVATS